MSLNNLVHNGSGTLIAGFLSSHDARSYANTNSKYYDKLTVTDWTGSVTEHVKGKGVILTLADQSDTGISEDEVRRHVEMSLQSRL